MYSNNIKSGKEVDFTSGLSSHVHLQGYMTWLRLTCLPEARLASVQSPLILQAWA